MFFTFCPPQCLEQNFACIIQNSNTAAGSSGLKMGLIAEQPHLCSVQKRRPKGCSWATCAPTPGWLHADPSAKLVSACQPLLWCAFILELVLLKCQDSLLFLDQRGGSQCTASPVGHERPRKVSSQCQGLEGSGQGPW